VSLRTGHDASKLSSSGLLGAGHLLGLSASSATAGEWDEMCHAVYHHVFTAHVSCWSLRFSLLIAVMSETVSYNSENALLTCSWKMVQNVARFWLTSQTSAQIVHARSTRFMSCWHAYDDVANVVMWLLHRSFGLCADFLWQLKVRRCMKWGEITIQPNNRNWSHYSAEYVIFTTNDTGVCTNFYLVKTKHWRFSVNRCVSQSKCHQLSYLS